MRTIAIAAFSLSLALFGCGNDADPSSGGSSGTAGGESGTALPPGGIQKTSDCLGSPLVGTCYDTWGETCLVPEGACTNEALTSTKNRWTWDNGFYTDLEIVAVDEADPDQPIIVASFTGYEADDTLCLDGQIETIFQDKTTFEFTIKGETFVTVFYNEYIENRVDLYCPDGSSFQMDGDDAEWVRSCFFGPYAENCSQL